LTKLRFLMMKHTPNERRTRRSDDVMTALHYQLAFARHEGGFDALVLADSAGCLVAGAGAWPTCEMLAACAPLLAEPPSPSVEDALADQPRDLAIEKLMIDGSEVLLCGRGGGSGQLPGLAMTRAASGCRRILGAQA